MDNSTSRKPINRTEDLWSAEGDNEKSKHSKKTSEVYGSRDMKYINWETMYQGKLKMKEIHNKMSQTTQMQRLKVNMLTYLTILYHQKKELSNSQMTSMRMNF